ncbi:MAG: NAD(P)/FAD-dependent oxidoreductase [Halofilum sp. (in: g-proteobacteria)]
MSGRDIVVVGSGVIGISCARWLQRDGHRVRVLDPLPPGQGCSFGNAGVFAVDSIIPVATPQTLKSVPRMLLSPASPLRLCWRDLPRLTPWLLRFALRARHARVRAATETLAGLCAAAMEGYRVITEDRPAAALMRHTGWATVFEHAATAAAARPAMDERERHGWRVRWLEGSELHARIPGLRRDAAAAAELPDVWMCADPAGFVERMADDLRADGGTIESERVTSLRPNDSGVHVETLAGAIQADHVVVAAGVDSERLAAALGDHLGLAAERGYHAMLASGDGAPPMPIMSGEHKFVTTPMARGVRMAGTSEFARADRPADPRRVEVLLERGRNLFPGLRTGEYEPWLGSRSTTPDSVPVIGRSSATQAVTYACGHQHLGLTLAGVTGRLVADDLAGRDPGVDMRPLRANRFRIVSR